MAAPMDVVSAGKTSGKVCEIEATVVTGFEPVAKAEVEEKLNAVTREHRGRISIDCPIERVTEVIELGSVDNCRVVLNRVENFKFTDNQIDNLQRLRNYVGEVDWVAGLEIWRKFFSFEHPIASVPDVITTNFGEVTIPPPRQTQEKSKKSKSKKRNNWKKKREEAKEAKAGIAGNSGPLTASEHAAILNIDEQKEEVINKSIPESSGEPCGGAKGDSELEGRKGASGDADVTQTDNVVGDDADGNGTDSKKPRVRMNPWDPSKPSFRVTCHRSGTCQNFDSMSAASNFGGAIYQYFGWNVKMKDFDIEVILIIEDQEVSVCIGLTKESLHHRNIGHFGATTLRPTIAHSMLRLCEIEPGDIVCDPMCGTGSIPIQSSIEWPYSYNLCGEIAKRSIERCRDNLTYISEKRKLENRSKVVVDPVRWNVCGLPLRDKSVDVFITDLPFGLRVGSRLDNWKLYPAALMEMARVVKPESGRICLLTQDKKCMIKTLQAVSLFWHRTRTLGINMGGLAAGVYVMRRSRVPFCNIDLKISRGSDMPKNSFDKKPDLETDPKQMM